MDKSIYKPVIICIIIFYLIGDLYTATKIAAVKAYNEYQINKREKEYQEYLNSPEYKKEQEDEMRRLDSMQVERNRLFDSLEKESERELEKFRNNLKEKY